MDMEREQLIDDARIRVLRQGIIRRQESWRAFKRNIYLSFALTSVVAVLFYFNII